MNTATLKNTLTQIEIRAIFLTLAISIAIPFMVHLIPPIKGWPLGAFLLPIYFAPLIAVIKFRLHVAIVAGLLSPYLNMLITGHPMPIKVVPLTIEVIIFSVVVYLILRKWHKFPAAAPIGFLAAIASRYLFSLVLPSVVQPMPLPEYALRTLVFTIPGVIILTIINWLLVRTRD